MRNNNHFNAVLKNSSPFPFSVWNNALNRNCAVVPDSNTDAFVNNGTVVVSTAAVCRTLTLAPAAMLTVNNGITLNVYK